MKIVIVMATGSNRGACSLADEHRWTNAENIDVAGAHRI